MPLKPILNTGLTNSSFVVLTADGGLANERVLTAGTNITITDNGANGTLVIASTGGGGSSLTDSASLAATISDETGTGVVVFNTSPTLVTPLLGTPTSGTLTNCTGLPVASGISGLGASVATFLATPSSANLLAAVTDETGTGALVFGTAPTFTTNITTPKIIGGTGTTSTLTYQTTTGVGTTNADHIFLVGNNGATEAMRIFNSGAVTINGALNVTSGGISGGSVTLYGSGGGLRTSTSAGNNVLLQARDVDGAAYSTFITLTANNTPSCTIEQPSGGSLIINAIDSTTTIADNGDTTKKWAVQCSGITTATTRTSTIPDTSGTLTHRSTGAFNADLTATSTITWDGTAPTTPSARYSWQQIGGYVFYDMRLEYTGAGVTNTSLTITLPSDMPTPQAPTGAGNSEACYAAYGQGYTSNMTGNGSAAKGVLSNNSGSTGFEILLKGMTSGSMVGAVVSGHYPVASASRL